MKRLENKVALITGGARGMGASHVLQFVNEGAKVYFTDILVEEGEKLAKEIGENAIFLKQDVGNEEDWIAILDKIEKNEGKLDILVKNAAVGTLGLIGEMTLEQYNKIININQVSIFLSLTHALPLLKKSGKASVINISSLAGIKAILPGTVAYGSSKHAIRGLTQSAALEFGPFNIRVNCILPGMIKTPIHGNTPKEVTDAVTATIPLNREGQPVEMSHVVLFLASDEASFCNGSEIVVDGGALTK